MMTVDVNTARLRFDVPFPIAEMRDLQLCAQHHYDALCKRQANYLKNKADFAEEDGKKEVTLTLGWDDLDTLAKICEQMGHVAPSSQAPGRVRTAFQLLREMTLVLSKALPNVVASMGEAKDGATVILVGGVQVAVTASCCS